MCHVSRTWCQQGVSFCHDLQGFGAHPGQCPRPLAFSTQPSPDCIECPTSSVDPFHKQLQKCQVLQFHQPGSPRWTPQSTLSTNKFRSAKYSNFISQALRDGPYLLSKIQNSFSCMFPLLQVFMPLLIHDFSKGCSDSLPLHKPSIKPPIRCSSL